MTEANAIARAKERSKTDGRSPLGAAALTGLAGLAALAAVALGGSSPVRPSPSVGAGRQDPAAVLRRLATLESTIEVAGHVVEDIDGDGRDDVVLVGTGGQVRVWRPAADGASIPVGSRVLPHPERSIFAVGDVLGNGTRQLIVLSVDGARAYPGVPGGGFDGEPILLSRRARLAVRVGTPRAIDMLQDVNRDGRPDLLVPTAGRVEVWLAEAPDATVGAVGDDSCTRSKSCGCPAGSASVTVSSASASPGGTGRSSAAETSV